MKRKIFRVAVIVMLAVIGITLIPGCVHGHGGGGHFRGHHGR